MKNVKNAVHIEGLVYESKLELKTSGPNSKNPGTEFINGTLDIATDNACTNIVSVHFTYSTATTAKGTPNATFGVLKNIIDGKVGTVMRDGKDNAGKVRIDTAFALNDFYSNRNGDEELVSAKRNEGGFVHLNSDIAENEAQRATFDVDMIITATQNVDADEDRGTPEKLILKGAIFDFRKSLLPYEFSVTNPAAISYFEGCDISSKNPLFTELKGNLVSETITRKIEEESAFGEANVREVKSSRKDMVVTWAGKEPYLWDDTSTITATEFAEALQNREIYLAGVKKRQDDYNASRGSAIPAAKTASNSTFNF